MIRRAMIASPGVIACLLALGLGASWGWTALALLLYGASLVQPPRPAGLALLVAPIALSVGGHVPTVASLTFLAWVAVALLAVLPFFVRLGAGVPWRGALIVWLGLPLLLAPLLALAWAPSLLTSDIAPRTQVVLLAMATLLLLSGMEMWAAKRSGTTES